ncbi:MAG TPA: hypothetical protein VGE77_13735 [Nocardioides sp.]
MRGTDEVEAYGEVGATLEAACVSVVPTTDVAAVAALWGVDLDAPMEAPEDGPPYETDVLTWQVWFVPVDGHVVVVEDNGYRGNDADLAAAASRLGGGGRVAVAYWNIEAVVTVLCAESGEVLVGPDEVRVGLDAPAAAADVDDLLAPFRRLVEEGDLGPSWVGTALAVAARWTGVPITEDLLDMEGRAVYLVAEE